MEDILDYEDDDFEDVFMLNFTMNLTSFQHSGWFRDLYYQRQVGEKICDQFLNGEFHGYQDVG